MTDDPSITNVDDKELVDLINLAGSRVLLLTPGVSEEVARALGGAWKRLGCESVDVIVDVDPEVCRLGYGTLEGLRILQDAADNASTVLRHQAGVRIGLLISDDTTIIFSPTPLLMESGSSRPELPNAIRLFSIPKEMAKDVGLGEDPAMDCRVGLDPVEDEDITRVKADLDNNPPGQIRPRSTCPRFHFSFSVRGDRDDRVLCL